jgi:hypothetical protein
MTARKPAATPRAGTPADTTPATTPEFVSVEVRAPHAVYFDGEQRTGTLHDVPYTLAQHWERHGWADVVR